MRASLHNLALITERLRKTAELVLSWARVCLSGFMWVRANGPSGFEWLETVSHSWAGSDTCILYTGCLCHLLLNQLSVITKSFFPGLSGVSKSETSTNRSSCWEGRVRGSWWGWKRPKETSDVLDPAPSRGAWFLGERRFDVTRYNQLSPL